eukprot:CAMPEP_0201282706 /NCGR_PEP_ID=MMETSP1317-20130820/6431_1 /ASSEMBLY_ACC=CAM_ASM_000770 /TAXON_ID=187299 /ORGANISM="Undescribed Undescribed, Strain Undescribed" /LENGTH=98 /DNA_ID=CAMNT_0047596319 /DNA_START=833 /DNA_END=1129 /DNA_ORIENTATION=+
MIILDEGFDMDGYECLGNLNERAFVSPTKILWIKRSEPAPGLNFLTGISAGNTDSYLFNGSIGLIPVFTSYEALIERVDDAANKANLVKMKHLAFRLF